MMDEQSKYSLEQRDDIRSVGRPEKMEQETLLEGLQNILHNYDGMHILREMVQNAEDAGATCMKIIYDNRPIDPGESLNISKYFKGPGICVYNDESFKEIDWRGIKKIGASFKRKLNEPLKIGRFGQGFKSVFHLTDHVVIVSGKQLLIIDPLKSEQNQEDCLSVSFKELPINNSIDRTFSCIEDKFGFNIRTVIGDDAGYKGTLFWINLRQNKSSLSHETYSTDDVKKLFNMFAKEAPLIPLFLRNIRLIEIQVVEISNPVQTIKIEREERFVNNKTLTTNNEEYMSALQNIEQTKTLPLKCITSIAEVLIKTYSSEYEKKTTDQWVVVNSFTGTEELSDYMAVLCRDKGLSLNPYTGIAFCTDSSREQSFSGHVFCFLPLPLRDKSMTGLPVHVNGCFALEHNRCHIKFGYDEDQTDNAPLWNSKMISELLPKTYLHLMRYIKSECESRNNSPDLVKKFYYLFPDPVITEPEWHPLLKDLYKILLEEPNFYTSQQGGRWVELNRSMAGVFYQDCNQSESFSLTECIQETLKSVLLDNGENFVEIPQHIQNVFKWLQQTPKPITPQVVREAVRKTNGWQSYNASKKLDLLAFILQDREYSDLAGLKLLPLSDGTYETYLQDCEDIIYAVQDEHLEMFPGLEHRLVCSKTVTNFTWSCLLELADRELFQLRLMTKEVIPSLLLHVFELNCRRLDDYSYVQNETSRLDLNWVRYIWNLIQRSQLVDLQPYENIPLIPILEDDVLKSDEEMRVWKFLRLKGNYMLTSFENQAPICRSVQSVVELTGMQFLSQKQTLKFTHADVIGVYIKTPTPENIIFCLENPVSKKSFEQIANDINTACNDSERLDFSKFLNNHCSVMTNKSKTLLTLLKIFRQTDNINIPEMISLKENNNSLKKMSFPDDLPFPRKVLIHENTLLMKFCGTNEVNQSLLLRDVLDHMKQNAPKYTLDDRRKIMIYIKSQPANLFHEIIESAKGLVFVPSTDGNFYKIPDLFDPTCDKLTELFLGEHGRFPDKDFTSKNNFMPLFKSLGIKGIKDITENDIVSLATNIETNSESIEFKMRKAEAFFNLIVSKEEITNEKILAKIHNLKWVPYCTKKPDSFPFSLDLVQSDDRIPLCCPNEAKSKMFENLIGSVKPLVPNISPGRISEYYMWNLEPQQETVIQHLENVIRAYSKSGRSQNSKYINIAKLIFAYLDEHRIEGKLSYDSKGKLRQMKCIPTNNKGFKSVKKVIFKMEYSGLKYRLDLEPYIFELACELEEYLQTFTDIGMKSYIDFELLEDVLKQIKQKYSHESYDKSQVITDRKLAADILKTIVSMNVSKTVMSRLFIPIYTGKEDKLEFETVENCTFSDEVRTTPPDSNIKYSHPDISEFALLLGVPSVIQRTFKQNTVFVPWGQQKPLTTSIANCLDGYKDGFSIPKELLQNAEDAKATKICFLYDERENTVWRDRLFDQGMTDCQGQAFWVYNDAVFQEEDFKNILKVGGKTKLKDREKIGKFGLGFCSVYNLTDVPSFVSENNLVILDPHLHHLGDAIQDMVPGVRVKITNSIVETYPNQFKPYEDIFGFKVAGTRDFNFKGTLFRFPLRTCMITSRKSLIKDEPYRKKDMVELIEKLIASAANLLLFTQNVKEIDVYYLHSDSKEPQKDMKLVFRAFKKFIPNDNCNSEENVLKTVIGEIDTGKNPQSISRFQTIDIHYEVTNNALHLSNKLKPLTEKQSWLLSWNTGQNTFDLAKNLKSQGAVPIGGIAVPVMMKEGNISLVELSKVPSGFYNESHIFCFLPLPLKTPLPVHLNGCFMVEHDRKDIITFNEDEILNLNSRWNETMLTDVIQISYINLLAYFVSVIDLSDKTSDVESNYWRLWPTSYNNRQDINKLIESFYKSIFTTDPIIFFRRDLDSKRVIRISLSGTKFLEPNFRHEHECGQIAFECMMQFHNGNDVIIDIPAKIFEMLSKTNAEQLEKKVVTKCDFYHSYFFPHLQSAYWEDHDKAVRRNKLLSEAFEDISLHDYITNTKCVPVQPFGKLRKPRDLVLKYGVVSSMFQLNDERFPINTFEIYEKTLISMGMMVEKVSSEVLLHQIKSVEAIFKDSPKIAQEQAFAILQYLNENIEFHLNVTDTFHNISFLPVMPRPRNWPSELPWKGDANETLLTSPVNVYCPEEKELIGSIRYVILSPIPINKRVSHLIGIPEVTIEEICEQLELIGQRNITYCHDIETICSSVYCRLNQYLNNNTNSSFLIAKLKQMVHQNIVCTETKMVAPCRLSLKLSGNCSPYIYQMNNKFQAYDNLWQYMGIPEHFGMNAYLDVLKEKKMVENDQCLSQPDILSIVNILKNICITLKRDNRRLTTDEKSQIYIPDTEGVLRSFMDISFDDKYEGLLYGGTKLHCIHEEIEKEFGMTETLEILSKRNLHMSKFSNILSFGQSESLVTRLKGIITANVLNHSILNELLQNADDAGATEIHFVLDMRQHATQHIFNQKWAKFQGPALSVFNNSCFSQIDISKIQALGEGSKVFDPTKTGQFGLGFNVVYHLTDVPSFITRGLCTHEGGMFCVFDPHCTNVSTAELDSRGFQFNDLSILEKSYPDVYNSYLQNELSAQEGTWFRFPLRTKEMAENSEISKEVIEIKSIEMMFREMKTNMKKCLLFLSNVRKISLSHIQTNSSQLSNTYTVELNMSDISSKVRQDFMLQTCQQLELVKKGQKQLNEIELLEVKYDVRIEDDMYADDWIIVQAFGFTNLDSIPKDLIEAYREKQIVLSPRGGTAKCVFSSAKHKVQYVPVVEHGNAFCFLPLPVKTGLPVHINGHFALTQNRTHIYDTNTEDIKYIWNKSILTHTVAHTYASCLHYYQCKVAAADNTNEIIKFFGCFPISKFAKSDFWRKLTISTYLNMYNRHLPVLPVCPLYMNHTCGVHPLSEQTQHQKKLCVEKWVPMHSIYHTIFDDLHKSYDVLEATNRNAGSLSCTFDKQHQLRRVLVDIGMNLVCTPLDICESINKSCKDYIHNKCQSKDNGKKNPMSKLEEALNKDEKLEEDCICTETVSPKVVLAFLKRDKGLLNCINTELSKTKFENAERIVSVLQFCLMDKSLTIEDFVGVPLLLNNQNNITIFERQNKLILSELCDLLPRSSHKFVHVIQVSLLSSFQESFKKLNTKILSKYLHASLDSSVYKRKIPIDWTKIGQLSEGFIVRLWEFLDTQDNIDEELKEWCLIPCTWFHKESKLVSFNLSYVVFFEKEIDNGFSPHQITTRVILKLNPPSPNIDYCQRKHLLGSVATISNPEKVLQCLCYHNNELEWEILNAMERETILKYFNDVIATQSLNDIQTLKSLCLFTTVLDSVVKLENTKTIIVVKSEHMTVFSGIDDLCKKKETIILKYNNNHDKLYPLLGCLIYYPAGKKYIHPLVYLYTKFILPNFSILDKHHHIPHLKFIRDELLDNNEIKMALAKLKFIPSEDGRTLREASCYFSPQVKIFQEMCCSTNLPPNPYSDEEWKVFMECAGIKCNVTKDMLIEFARNIQLKGIFPNSEKKSKLLIEHLFSLPDSELDQRFLSEVGKINFITPYLVPEEYTTISSPMNINRLVAFNDAITQNYMRLCWTMALILPEYAVPSKDLLTKYLKVKEKPDTKTVVSHMHKVCESVSQNIKSTNEKLVKELMQSFYEYLNSEKTCWKQAKISFSQTPIIFVVEHKILLPATNVVFHLPRNKEIVPYLLKCSDRYGAFFELFKEMGASENVTIEHYCRVLSTLKNTAKEKEITPDELNTFEKAFTGLLYCLKESSTSDISLNKDTTLFLLNNKNVLIDSRHLILNDNLSFQSRIAKESNINIICDLRSLTKLIDCDIHTQLLRLPENCRPVKLSSCVTETILHKEPITSSVMASRLEAFLSGEIFGYVIVRLLKNYQLEFYTKVEEEEINQTLIKLRTLRVFALGNLETVLSFRKTLVGTSKRKREVFYDANDNIMFIQYNKEEINNWVLKNSRWVAKEVLKLATKLKISDVQDMLHYHNASQSEVEAVLNEYGIVDVDYEFDETSWYPLPGTLVHDEFLDFLCSEFSAFEIGDHAVYEILDNVTNYTEAAIYIHVKIVGKIANELETFPLYLINTGEESDLEVRSHQLYKIVRTVSSATQTIEPFTDEINRQSHEHKNETFKTVEETLVDAWCLGQLEFKQILRRLILKWHPDKNQNSSFCNEVFKHLTEFVNLLQSADIDISAIIKNRKLGSCQWKDLLQATQKHDVNDNGYAFDIGGFADIVKNRQRKHKNHSGTFNFPNPQPHMGRVWLQQAKYDLCAAHSSIKTATNLSYNWVCVQSHQAAEKALKAVQVVEDANEVGQGHSLMTSFAFKNPTLEEAARKLEATVGNYSRMRYPRSTLYPKTPSELYTKEDAEQAVKLASIIVETVQNQYF